MTSDETVIEPTATPKPMRDRFFLVAGFVGAIAGLLASVAAAVLLGESGVGSLLGSDLFALIVGTLVTGYIGRARSPTRWVISFALTLVMYVLLRVIFAVVVVAMIAV